MLISEEDVFVTSDKPLAIKHKTKARPGFGTKDALLTFPISPRRMLMMDDMHDEPSNQYYALSTESIPYHILDQLRGASQYMLTGRDPREVLMQSSSVKISGED